MNGEAGGRSECPDICFGFGDDILGGDWRGVLNLDIFGWFLLLCGQLPFRRFFVGFFLACGFWHLGDERNFGHCEGSRRSQLIISIMAMDSDVVLLGTDLPTSILAASVSYLFEPLPVLT